MKTTNRDHELARERRAAKRASRTQKRQRRLSMLTRAGQGMTVHHTDRALAPLRSTILIALGLTGTLGCRVNEPLVSEREVGELGGMSTAGELGGTSVSGVIMGGEITGGEVITGGEAIAGGDQVAGTGMGGSSVAGESVSGEMMGGSSVAGESVSGEMMGGSSVAGESTGGDLMPSNDVICDDPVPQYNDFGELNGYTWCARGIVIKTGPANCASPDPVNPCNSDDDCGEGEQCLCGTPTRSISRCVPAECTSGSECELGSCGVASVDNGCDLIERLSCFTENDMCRSAEDCDEFVSCFPLVIDDGWQCEEFFCGEGRPLLDDGEARVAPLECSNDWVATLPKIDDVDLCQRDLDHVIKYWRSVTQLEHSSVASFARFALQMMSLGAPAELLAEIQLAAADEVKHAQSAAEVLSALSGAPLSPGVLSIVDMSLETSRVALIESLILEACVGETLGVAEITEALRYCNQELVQAHLQQVLEDETRHAGLAWSSLLWLIESAPHDERSHLICVTQEMFRRAADDLGLTAHTVPVHVTPNLALNSWGVLSPSQTQAIRARAYHTVLLPCLRELERRFIAA